MAAFDWMVVIRSAVHDHLDFAEVGVDCTLSRFRTSPTKQLKQALAVLQLCS